MQELNLPEYEFKIKSNVDGKSIYDIARKKFVALTPEEWVRQHWIHYLSKDLNYPLSLMIVEASLKVNNLRKRADIVIYNQLKHPYLIVECKAPNINLTNQVFSQIINYYSSIKAEILIVSNGLKHVCFKFNHTTKQTEFLNEIPAYQTL
ncbi:MAG: type I restriction enzyme HsdR N-terminal domain-containing protein [Bacteroidia bacterium]